MGVSNDRAAQLVAGLNAPRFVSMADASRGLQAGIQSFRSQQAEEGKRKSMEYANQYVSDLLGKGDAESIKQARTMLPYADKQFAEQAQYMVHDIERGQDIKHRDDVFAETKAQNLIKNEQFQKTFEQTDRLAREKNALQMELQKMNESGANYRAQLSASTQLAGINKQIAANEAQMKRMEKKADIDAQKESTKYVRGLLDSIDVGAGVKSHASTLGWWQPQDTSRVSEYGMGAKNLLLKYADNLKPEQARYFKGLFDTGKFGQAVYELKQAGMK